MLKALQRQCLAMCIVFGASPGYAQDGWDLSVGIVGSAGPQHIGSENAEYYIFPIADASKMLFKDTRFFIGAIDGVGLEKFHSRFSYGIALNYRSGIKGDDFGLSGDDEGLEEMLDHGSTVTAKPYIKADLGAWAFKLDLEKGLESNNQGLVTGVTTSYAFPFGESFHASLNGHAKWADDAYMDDYFGVDLSEVTSSRAVHEGKAGVLSYGVSVDLFVALSEKNSLFANFTANTLTNDVAESDIVQDKFQPQLTLGYMHRFK